MADWTSRFSLEGRRALVTGASRGIGFEICTVLADAGASIIASARDSSALGTLQQQINDKGGNCTVLECDLNHSGAIETLCASALQSGTVDILVNNAGIAEVAPALELSLDSWDRTMAVNVRAAFQIAQRLAPAMIEQRRGKIINISSQAGVVALDDHVAYSASKAAMNALTRGLMIEWARYNIQINSICPTVILTDMGREVWGPEEKSGPMMARIPSARFGEQVEVADLALFLASPASALINGETIMLDGGYSAV